MKQLKSECEVPPRCYAYTVPETGVRVPEHGTQTLAQCKRNVQDHYRANGYAVPANLHERIVEECCRVTEPDRCWEVDVNKQPLPVSNVGRNFTFHAVVACLRTLASWAISYRSQQVDQVELERRAAICMACPFNHTETGCSACNNRVIQEFLNRIVGVKRQPLDDKLHSCGICGCKLSAKIRLPLEPLVAHTADNLKEQFKAHAPSCWMNV